MREDWLVKFERERGDFMKNELIEIGKEVLRNAVLGAISYILTAGVSITVINTVTGNALPPDVVVVIAGGITFVLRGIEKQLHKAGSKYSLPI